MTLIAQIRTQHNDIATVEAVRTATGITGEHTYEARTWVRGLVTARARFQHQEDDGALVCIRKALEALEGVRGSGLVQGR